MLQNNSYLEIYNETDSQIPKDLRILDLKDEILGKKYTLYLSILKGVNSKRVNIKQRKKDYVPNTLSFQYTETSGEIILTPQIIKKEMKIFGNDYNKHFSFLLIHSMLHLKNHDHGDKMEKLEEKYLKKYLKV